MSNPTPGEIDAAVPPAGVPSRTLTNDVFETNRRHSPGWRIRGKFVRIRVGSVTGTASATINATQQETLL